MNVSVTLDAVTDWAALGMRWRELETRAACSFFQGWSWIGCLAEERFDRPVLLDARQDGRTVALALFNHRPGRLRDTLWLHESGDAQWDDVFIEYNGVLMAAGADAALCAACLTAARHVAVPAARRGLFGRRMVLSGVDAVHLAASQATGPVVRMLTRVGPVLDLAALRRQDRRHLDVLSANTRAQLRRSLRAYAGLGPLCVTRVDDAGRAHQYLDALAALHQAGWQSRGRPGAFANPRFARFHHTLIDRALPRGEIDLLRITAGAAVIGYLYNFHYRGRVLAYQSGFNYATADHHQKPGLTCHHLAIERSLDESDEVYDFLAGGDRYKRSLSDSETTHHWLTLGPRLDPERLKQRMREAGTEGAPRPGAVPR